MAQFQIGDRVKLDGTVNAGTENFREGEVIGFATVFVNRWIPCVAVRNDRGKVDVWATEVTEWITEPI